MKKLFVAAIVGAVLCVCATTQAQNLVVDRPLPNANLNNTAGALRSNVSWAFVPNNTYFSGDDFTIPGTGQFVLTKIRLWGTAGVPNDLNFNLSQRYTNATLYLGPIAGPMSAIKSGNLLAGTDTTDNPDITFARTTYNDALSSHYQGSNGSYIQLWQADIDNLYHLVNAEDVVKFGLHILTTDANRYWFNHSSNAALSGLFQQGSDDVLRWFDVSDLDTGDGTFDSKPISLGGDGGWDKSSDVNVMVWAIPLTDGMATGGGWYLAESGDFVGGTLGRANFGFVARQARGRSSGQLEFQYAADGLNLKSQSYDFVGVSATQVIFEGTGTLNGWSGYKFRVTAADGDKAGGQPDRFSITIFTQDPDSPVHRSSGELAGGQITVHKK